MLRSRLLSLTADLAVSPQFHVDKKGRVNFAQTELLIHVVNRETNRILDVERYIPWPPPSLAPWGPSVMSRYPSNPSLPRVIQMIDENKEQLRNLFRNYNVLDVQPAITARAPDDLSALQVRVWLGLEVLLAEWVVSLSHGDWSVPGEIFHPYNFGHVATSRCWLHARGSPRASVSPRWQSSCWPSCSSWLPCSSSS